MELIQNYFVRTVGHSSNVNFEDINLMNWQRFATILNTLGPSKTGMQWKSVSLSFYQKLGDSIRKMFFTVILLYEEQNSKEGGTNSTMRG